MGGCATKENKENKPAEDADGCVLSPAGIYLAYQTHKLLQYDPINRLF